MSVNDSAHSKRLTTSDENTFGGLIPQSPWELFRKNLVQLFSYVSSVAPKYGWLNKVVTFFRMIQFIGPCWCASIGPLYEDKSTDQTAIHVLSILWQLIPPKYRDDASFYVIGIISGIYLIIFLIVAISYYSFKRNAKLNGTVASLIDLFFQAIGELFPVLCFVAVFEKISKLINMSCSTSEVTVSIILIVINFVLIGCYFFINCFITSESLIFRPQPLAAILPSPTNLFWVVMLLITAVQSISVNLSKMAQFICCLVMALIYLFSGFIPFFNGGFVSDFDNHIIFASAISCFLFSLFASIFILIGQQLSLIYVCVFIVLFIVIYFATTFALKYIERSDLAFLDRCIDDNTLINSIKLPNSFIRMAITGIKNSHPICIDWKFFNVGVEKWPKNGRIWLVFAKMIAIYPQEIRTLSWIYHTINTMKLSGFCARTIKEQSLTLGRMRESNLSPELKYRINVLNKHVTSSKHKMRHVFDIIIQGNINEMESSTQKLWMAIEKNEADYKHLLRQYPNNRFVSRAYARFLNELLADHQGQREMNDKTSQLRRGIAISTDEAHVLGLQAFPNLVDHVGIAPVDSGNDISLSESAEVEEPQNSVDEDEIEHIRDQISNISIKSLRNSIIFRIVFLIVLFIIPVIAFTIYSNNYINSSVEIITHMYVLAEMRTIDYQLASFSHRYIFEKLGQFPPLNPPGNPPVSLGSTFDTGKQVEFLLRSLTALLQQVSAFKTFKSDSEAIIAAKNLIFDQVTPYIFYITMDEKKEDMLNVQTALLDFVVQLTDLTSLEINVDTINTSHLLNPNYNADAVTTNTNLALGNMTAYLADVYNESVTMCNIIYAIVIPVIVITYVIFIIIQIMAIKRVKEETYGALIALPKNAVSTLAENLRVLKNETANEENDTVTQTTELSKQEEYILKVFNTGGSSVSTAVIDSSVIIGSELLIILFHVLSTYFLIEIIKKSNQSIVLFAPHLDYLMGAYSNTVTMVYSNHNTLMSFYPNYIRLWDREGTIWYFNLRTGQARDYYFKARFGGTSIDQTPFRGFAAALESAKEKINCSNEDLLRKPKNIEEATRCLEADVAYAILNPIIDQTIYAYHDQGKNMDSFDQVVTTAWNLLVDPIFEKFFSPMFETIVPTIEEQLNEYKYESYLPACILAFVAIIIELVGIHQIISIQKHMKSVLYLLLHFQPSIILQTNKIMKILGGNFSSNKNDQTRQKKEFYDEVLESMKDAVFIVDQQNNQIEKANKSCERIFGESCESYVGKNVVEVFKHFYGYSDQLFSSHQKIISMTIKKPDGDEINIDSTSLHLNGKMAIVTSETTLSVRYNKLITAERNRSDKLLASILPPSLVKRVQAGEKTISFEVQSATIVFMDIVSFTPWCGSLPAAAIMSTLNKLFKLFDASTASQPTMTKIKCIGDCYMAAGGIFDKVNQPAVHAKEVVTFGLLAIDNVTQLNKEIGESLKIRVGVNTGGPIVAGVLGGKKPTFEIIGPAINMAQQMEHNGVPMEVHISRSVYELIYGDSFSVKERGTIEVKGGNVQTYLVTSKKE